MVAPKLNNLETSISSTISLVAEKYNAINMAEGFTDFSCPPHLVELVQKYISQGLNRFAPVHGVMALRERIAEKIESLYGRIYHPENEITITAGSTQAIFATITSLIKEGDEVLIFEPAFESYVPAIQLNGGKPVFVPLKAPNYHIDWEEVQKMINRDTRMIIINNPHNPTGAVMSELDMLRLQKIINGTKIIILSDEIFEHMIYDGGMHQSVALYPKLAERSIIVSSFGELFHVTGWQIGYCVGPEKIMKEIRKIHQTMVYSVNEPFQMAIAEFLKIKDEYIKLSVFYQNLRNKFTIGLEDSKFKIIPSQGTFYQLLDYQDLSNLDDKKFAEQLLKDHGVACIPLSSFYHEKTKAKLLRFNFARNDDNLNLALERLCKL